MILRLVQSQWAAFAAALCVRHDVETAGLLLAERLPGGDVLLARELLVVPDDGYLVRRHDQLRIDPVVFNRLVRSARDRGWSVFTVHTHPKTERPWFSAADDAGDARLMPSLFAQMPGPHGSVVIAGDSGVLAARAWTTPTGDPAALGARLVGPTLRALLPATTQGNASDGASEPWFARQLLALGADGQTTLRALHVGIVGLGGTGSVVLTQLAHLGVGRLTLVDADRVEASNVSRIVGSARRDAGCAAKVDVAARYVEQLGLGTELRVLRGALGPDVVPDALADCDIIVSCVDAHTPRALLNRLAYAHAIPLIDLGSAFRVDPQGRVVAAAGRLVVVGPGRPCLACWGHLDPTRLRLEALPHEDRAQLAAEGYIQGMDVPQPSVIAFNTTIAGAAVVELLRLVTAFAGADDPPLRLSFDFTTGTVRRNRLVVAADCRICGARPVVPPADTGAVQARIARLDLAPPGKSPDCAVASR
jgi:hypothetical protein